MACSSHGANASAAHRSERHRPGPTACRARCRRGRRGRRCPLVHRARSSSDPTGASRCARRRPPGRRARQPAAAACELVGVGHQLEQQAPLLQGAEHVERRERPVGRPHRADAAEAGRRHLPVDAAPRPRPPSRSAGGRRRWRRDGRRPSARRSSSSVSSIEWPPGGGGDVHQLLDVPAGGLGEVGGHVEAAGHPGDVAHVQLAVAPTGTGTSRCGRDPTGARGHRRSGRASSRSLVRPSSACTDDARSVSSSQSGTSGPPKVMLPLGSRVAAQAEPAGARRPARRRTAPTASGLHTRWAASSATAAVAVATSRR